MILHTELSNTDLWKKIKAQKILFGGNKKLGIYGLLTCKSGKLMKKENRVFFSSENEALENGYRPCGNCMYKEYANWKNGFI